ncbi:hypothetical protein GGS26DRAFT_157662 [Hypomontagnella submonticulosa]|nr:hypothetical protein GGS26DRAFT_157662 [Hypomontagnella submonticulosa]
MDAVLQHNGGSASGALPLICNNNNVPSPGYGPSGAFQDISPHLRNYGRLHENGLANKWCDHRDRGCPYDCVSEKNLCEKCERNECSSFHS